MKKFYTILLLLSMAVSAFGQERVRARFLGPKHCMLDMVPEHKYMLVPMQEHGHDDVCYVKVVVDNEIVEGTSTGRTSIRITPAIDRIDYYAPFDVSSYIGKALLWDIWMETAEGKPAIEDFICWKEIKFADTYDYGNTEYYRPVFHPTAAFGWQSDPNGLVWKDGVWHLYYQHNPYGSYRHNAQWGHSYSTDLLNWTYDGPVIVPDGLGLIFSGSCVVDHNNDAGFGEGTIIAFYTSSGDSETQSIAYSTDGGFTFTKYERNPILTEDLADFRDPHVFWNEDAKLWNMIVSAAKDLRIYSSHNLIDWTYESSFGQGYGCHFSSWECPNMFKLSPRDGGEERWVVLHSVNPADRTEPRGFIEYYTGSFDGRTFVPDTPPQVSKWLDYGTSDYAAVTFNNAPDNRRVVLGWTGYNDNFPTKQYRCCVTMPRDLDLYYYNGEAYIGVRPSPELLKMRGKAALDMRAVSGKAKVKQMFKQPQATYEVVIDLAPGEDSVFKLRLSNGKSEWVDVIYDASRQVITTDRTNNGPFGFGDGNVREGTVRGGLLKQLSIFVDRSNLDVFDGYGSMSMPSVIFPSEPYNTLECTTERGRVRINSIKVYPLNK